MRQTFRTPRVLAMTALLLAAPLLAGCLEASAGALDRARSDVGLPPKEVPARSLEPWAAKEARAWRADGALVGIVALEHADSSKDAKDRDGEDANDTDSDMADFPADPSVGNGKAPAWAFAYEAPDGAKLEFTVHVNHSITSRHESPAHKAKSGDHDATKDEPMHVVGEWPVNSDEAFKALAKNDSWQKAASKIQPRLAVVSLTPGDPDAGMTKDANASMDAHAAEARASHWFAMILNESGAGVMGIVNAGNGTIVAVAPWEPFKFSWNWDWNASGWGEGMGGMGCAGSMCGPKAEFEHSYNGQLTPASTSDSYDFPVKTAGAMIRVDLSATGATVPGGPDLNVLDPSGKPIKLKHACSTTGLAAGSICDQAQGMAGAPGTYKLVLSLPSPVGAMDYNMHLVVGGKMSQPKASGAAAVAVPDVASRLAEETLVLR